jgi:hypothetical protein
MSGPRTARLTLQPVHRCTVVADEPIETSFAARPNQVTLGVVAYRSDIEALEARKAALDGELADRTRERDEVAAMLAEARARQAAALAALEMPSTRRACGVAQASILACVIALFAALAVVRAISDDDRPSCRASSFSVGALEALADEACACKDAACGEAVARKLTAWSERARHTPVAKHDARVTAAATRSRACLVRVTTP